VPEVMKALQRAPAALQPALKRYRSRHLFTCESSSSGGLRRADRRMASQPVSAVNLTGFAAAHRLRQLTARVGAQGRPNLNDGPEFEETWSRLVAELKVQPLFRKEAVSHLEQDGYVCMRFGGEAFHGESLIPTPWLRPNTLATPPLDMELDYLSLAVACQLVLHLPDEVCQVHTFRQLYGGRLITDIIPEPKHIGFDGTEQTMDYTQDVEKAMRLHVDDADHLLRSPIQVLTGVKNPARTPTTVAVIPSEEDLRTLGCDTTTLRQRRYRHVPPGITPIQPDQVPLRPVLFGPPESPMVQADKKAISPQDPAAAAAWEHFHRVLQQRCTREVVVGTGDVLVLHNLRAMHGRGELVPVQDMDQRRWVKRLWLSSTSAEEQLQACHLPDAEHPRVFDRHAAFCTDLDRPYPWHGNFPAL